MTYYEKYLKYKEKYLKLKGSGLPDDDINQEFEEGDRVKNIITSEEGVIKRCKKVKNDLESTTPLFKYIVTYESITKMDEDGKNLQKIPKFKKCDMIKCRFYGDEMDEQIDKNNNNHEFAFINHENNPKWNKILESVHKDNEYGGENIYEIYEFSNFVNQDLEFKVLDVYFLTLENEIINKDLIDNISKKINNLKILYKVQVYNIDKHKLYPERISRIFTLPESFFEKELEVIISTTPLIVNDSNPSSSETTPVTFNKRNHSSSETTPVIFSERKPPLPRTDISLYKFKPGDNFYIIEYDGAVEIKKYGVVNNIRKMYSNAKVYNVTYEDSSKNVNAYEEFMHKV